jgi:signal transduction histidine kinase
MLRLKQLWMIVLTALVLIQTTLSLGVSAGRGLTAWTDLLLVFLISLASALLLANAFVSRGRTRTFWALMAAGCGLWAVNQGLWARYEVFLRRDVPDPFAGDVVLFLHIVPLIAAVALCPHRPRKDKNFYLYTLNFLILTVWWMFLYAFVVFPDEYVSINLVVYNHLYDQLYLLENLVLLAALAVVTFQTRGRWRKIYSTLLIAAGIYTVGSLVANAAITRGLYHTGSLYDVPFIACMGWLIWLALLGWRAELEDEPESAPNLGRSLLVPQLARLALLSLPIAGAWALFGDNANLQVRNFRLLVVLAATFVLGICLFIRQHLLDVELLRLVEESRDRLEQLGRLQSQFVQKEKLASLGKLAAGVAHEINNPLAAILGYAEILAASEKSPSEGPPGEHLALANKISQQARRTRDLVSSLLNFAQQTPLEKRPVDLGVLLYRATQMESLKPERGNIRIETSIAPGLPQVCGNSSQLFQCCVQIIGNALDAMHDTGGVLAVRAAAEGNEIVTEFSDSGPGLREPNRVFDPFYTTKPVGSGTGLGLSAAYGIIQDHSGQIECRNRPEGGAVFILRLPIAAPVEAAAQAGA